MTAKYSDCEFIVIRRYELYFFSSSSYILLLLVLIGRTWRFITLAGRHS